MEHNKPKRKDKDGNNDYIKSLQKPSYKDRPKEVRREYQRRDCRVCGGDGFYSVDGGDCKYCKGTGKENT
jgi:5-methylcytosine-specific restriction endonuclease McrA